MTEDEKIQRLERAVISKSPEEIKRCYEESGEVSFTAYALGLACRYRGLDTVKALAECGANFRYSDEADLTDDEMRFSYYKRSAGKFVPDCSLMLMESSNLGLIKLPDDLEILPVSERARVLGYLCDNAEKTGLDMQKLLYFSIIEGNRDFYYVLKRYGAEIPQKSRLFFKNACNFAHDMDNQTFLNVYGMIARELDDEKIRGNMTFYRTYIKNFLTPETFEFVLENFDKKGMSQTVILKMIIDKEAVSCLAIAEKEGWLKTSRKCDEMIQYAAENNKTECTAWLLEFQNRSFDLALERAKAEKKAERELNANPNSVTELKKIWKYEKREDGSIIITGCKGNRTEIVVPEKIGRSPVTAIGEYAFSPNAPRLTEEQVLNRCRITKITVPSTVRTIGAFAFGGSCCTSKNTNAVSMIEEIILPNSLEVFADKKSAENSPKMFAACPKLTVKVPHSPYAEIFCRKNKVNFEFYGG